MRSASPQTRWYACSPAHREQLEGLTAALLDVETLDELDAYAAAGVLREDVPALSPA